MPPDTGNPDAGTEPRSAEPRSGGQRPDHLTPRCWDCGTPFRDGEGYGEAQVFCSETCADAYRHELGA